MSSDTTTGAMYPTNPVPDAKPPGGQGGNSGTYSLSTESVMHYYVRNCTVDEDQGISDFCEWLAGIKDTAYREGRKDGEVFGDLR